MTRWRIMALLIEAMQAREFISLADVMPKQGATYAEVCWVMDEACMQRVTVTTWTPGPGTLDWWTLWMVGPVQSLSRGAQ